MTKSISKFVDLLDYRLKFHAMPDNDCFCVLVLLENSTLLVIWGTIVNHFCFVYRNYMSEIYHI